MRLDSNNHSTLNGAIDKIIVVFVRYGFKKKIEETQNYHGKLLSYDELGVMLALDTKDKNENIQVFFPWHNIDGIRIPN